MADTWILAAALLLASIAPGLRLEHLFAVQLVAGTGRWAGIPPLDLGLITIVTAALALKLLALAALRPGPAGSSQLRHNGHQRQTSWGYGPIAAWLAVLALSLLWSPSPEYGAEKLVRLAIFNIAPAYWLLRALRNGAVALDSQLASLRLAALVVAGFGVGTGLLADGGSTGARLNVAGADPIAFGVIASAGVLLWSDRLGTTQGLRRAACGLALLLCALAAVGSDSKGPLVALLVAMIARRLLARNAERTFHKWLVPVGVLGIAFVAIPSQYVQRLDPGLYRQEGASESIALRQRLYGQAITMFRERPITGRGLGGFNTIEETAYGERLPSGGATTLYPHNFALEVAAETGLLGTVSFAFVLSLMVGVALKPARRTEGVGLLALGIVASLFSGDIGDNRIIWYGLALQAYIVLDSTAQVNPRVAHASPRQRL